MSALDTNVLVRYLIADDARQHAAATRVMQSRSPDSGLFIPITVTLELEWVLRTRYGIDKSGIVDVYARLLETNGLAFQHEASVERALSLFTESAADFADCLHLALSISGSSLDRVGEVACGHEQQRSLQPDIGPCAAVGS